MRWWVSSSKTYLPLWPARWRLAGCEDLTSMSEATGHISSAYRLAIWYTRFPDLEWVRTTATWTPNMTPILTLVRMTDHHCCCWQEALRRVPRGWGTHVLPEIWRTRVAPRTRGADCCPNTTGIIFLSCFAGGDKSSSSSPCVVVASWERRTFGTRSDVPGRRFGCCYLIPLFSHVILCTFRRLVRRLDRLLPRSNLLGCFLRMCSFRWRRWANDPEQCGHWDRSWRPCWLCMLVYLLLRLVIFTTTHAEVSGEERENSTTIRNKKRALFLTLLFLESLHVNLLVSCERQQRQS